MIVAPLIVRDTVVGAMNFFSRTKLIFTDPDLDFIRKLSASLSLALENARLYNERKTMEEEMRHMAHHDSLTGLPNRRFFTGIAQVELAQAGRNRKKAAILFLDLDRFKEINDVMGHETGDALLKQVAERLKAQVRKSDTIARIGGDEFNVLLPDLGHVEDCVVTARKIIHSLQKPYTIEGNEFQSSASIGISVYPDDADELDTLLRYADIALYYAKEQGRNNFQFYNHAIHVRTIEQIQMEHSLQQSLERGELDVYYQPQVDRRTGTIVSAEALVRWKHPELGLLEPIQFLSYAEESGFIVAIDKWVLRTACAQAKSWRDAGVLKAGITVNLSARHFQDPELVRKISQILKETGLPGTCLGLEITETLAMSNIERTITHLHELSALGVHVSIDHFGTGYSSLSYLKRLPIQKLKIDRSFIRDIATDADNRAIITAMTAMAHSMNIKVLAEGVETEEQMEFIRISDCDEIQGFAVSGPLSPSSFEDFMKRTGSCVHLAHEPNHSCPER
jgi:diguanylate cyclase (GGDEF)-like protein